MSVLKPFPVKGLAPKVPPTSPVKEAPKPPEPVVSATGDVLLESKEFILGVVPQRHVLNLFHRTDPSQFFPFLAQCSCGFEARYKSELQIRKAADDHIRKHSV